MFIVVVFPDLRFGNVDHEEVAAGCVGRPFCNQRRGEVNGCVVDGERECIEEGVENWDKRNYRCRRRCLSYACM